MTIIVPSARSSSLSRTPLNGQNPAALYVLKRWAVITSFQYAKLLSIWSYWRMLSLLCWCKTANQGISAILPLDSMVHTIQRTEGYSATTGQGMVFHTHPTYPCPSMVLNGIRSSHCSYRAATMTAICPIHIMLIRIIAKLPCLFCLYWQVTIIYYDNMRPRKRWQNITAERLCYVYVWYCRFGHIIMVLNGYSASLSRRVSICVYTITTTLS